MSNNTAIPEIKKKCDCANKDMDYKFY